jgi:hypothetical protein
MDIATEGWTEIIAEVQELKLFQRDTVCSFYISDYIQKKEYKQPWRQEI